MDEHLIDIPGRLHSVAVEEHVAGTDQIYDDLLETTLDILNLENITDVKVQDGKLLFLNIQGLVLKEISIAFAQKQSDWNLTDSTQVDFIKGKPTVYNKLEVDDKLITKQDTINDLAAIRSGAQAGATAYQKPSTGIPATDLASAVQVSLGKADTALQEHQSLAGLVNTGSYNTVSKKIELKHDNTVLAEIDATAFIKDGMVSSVVVQGGYIVITFNTDAGKEAIRIPVTDIFDPDNYYDKDDVDGLLAGKANKIPASPIIHELVISGTTQVSDVITLITGHFYPRTYSQIDSSYTNPAVIEFTVNYTGKLRFKGKHESGGILEYIKAYVNGTLVETSAERITSATFKFDVEANDVVKVEFTRYVTGNFVGCIGDLSITSAGVSKDLVDVYNSLAPVATSGSYNDLSDTPTIPDITGKADKVSNATNGNFAALDSNGNLTDSGHKHSDYLTSHQDLSNYVQKSNTQGLLKNDGTVDTTQYLSQHQDISGKADKNEMSVVPGTGADADKTTITLKQGTSATVLTAHQDVSVKEDKMPITQVASGTTAINAAVNTYYEVAGTVGTLAITLPTPTDLTKVSMVVIHLTAGTTPNVVIGSTETIDYSAAYDISAGNEYEINCLFNGDKWVVADMEVV